MCIHVLTVIHVPIHLQYFSQPTVHSKDDLLQATTTGRKLQDITAELKDFQAQVPDTDAGVEEWTRFVRNDNQVYGSVFSTTKFREMTMNTDEYNVTKSNLLEGFLKSLYKHPTLQALAEPTKDENGIAIYRFFLLLRGVRTDEKKELLNSCVVVWGMSLKKTAYIDIDIYTLTPKEAADARLQTTTTAKLHRIFFKVLKDNSVQYQLGEFAFEGSFNSIWKHIFAETEKYRPDFGATPFAAVVDLQDLEKMRTAVPPLRPMENYTHMVMVLGYRLATELFLRAGREVSCSPIIVYDVLYTHCHTLTHSNTIHAC
jgi:hypothetical protein